MRIGVIFCAWQTEDYVERALAPWLAAKAQRLGGHDFVLCAVSAPFAGFDQSEPQDRTRPILGALAHTGALDHVVVTDKPIAETEARGRALRWLIDQGATDVIQADSDEFPTTDQLSRILAFWAARPHVCWARLSYKNRVFTPDQYLVEPFTPPRIHRVHAPGGGYRAHSFHQDNNVTYGGTVTRDLIPDERFPSVTVPKTVAWIDHWTWLNDARSRRKIEYQLKGRGWPTCTFDWDDSRGGLIFRDGMPPPEVARDSDPA